ncbi:PilZ domain-containing protein [Thalassotalea fusca]
MANVIENREQNKTNTVCLEKGIELLPVGANVTFEIERTDVVQEKFKSQYIGYQVDHALLFKMPSSTLAKHPELLNPSNIMTVRALSTQGEGAIIAFRSTILRHYAPPFAMLAASLPDKIQLYLLRHEPRFSLDLEANIKIGDQAFEGGLEDISISGCCFCCCDVPNVEIEDSLTIVLSQAQNNKTFKFNGVLKNIRKVNNATFLGISFNKDSLKDVEIMLQEFVLRGSRV